MARNQSDPRRDREDNPPAPGDQATPKKEITSIKDPMFWIGLLTLIVIGIYTYIASQQVTETQNANSIAKKALAEANKPYVMLSALNPNYTTDVNGLHLRIGFTLMNFGNTPASYLRFTNCDPIILNGQVAPNIECKISEKSSDEMVLGPKQLISFTGAIIDRDDLEATKDDKKSIYVFGYVTYQDSIDVDKNGFPEQRKTRFCQKVVQTQIQVIPPIIPKSPPPVPANAPPAIATASAPPTQAPVNTAPIAGLACPSFSCIDEACIGSP